VAIWLGRTCIDLLEKQNRLKWMNVSGLCVGKSVVCRLSRSLSELQTD